MNGVHIPARYMNVQDRDDAIEAVRKQVNLTPSAELYAETQRARLIVEAIELTPIAQCSARYHLEDGGTLYCGRDQGHADDKFGSAHRFVQEWSA